MMGVMSFWVGLMEIAQQSGMIRGLARRMQPIIRFLFPNLPPEHKANEYITLNMVMNIIGAGWAATPAGLSAMEELEKLEDSRRSRRLPGQARQVGVAGNEMCTFLVLNISSLQLIPVNIIAYRSQYGSVNPAAIVGPAILATAASTLVAVLFCKFADKKQYYSL
jgi:spore maturation protein A